jgi:hypothetical protein
MNTKMSPAALVAASKGDIDNFLVASTPGGIEAQEKAGQTTLVNSTLMPKEMRPSREDYEILGFVFGEEADEIFVNATLPTGWTRAATDHSMHSDILDVHGRRRVGIFYKAAFYDRRADAHLVPRFRVEQAYPEGKIDGDAMISTIITDGGVEIHRIGETKYIGGWEERYQLEKQAEAWLNSNRPGWRDPVNSWNI